MKNLPLFIGIALPVVFIIIVSIIIFTPSLFIKPEHNFVYSNEGEYSYYGRDRNVYAVENGQITLVPIQLAETKKPVGDLPTLFIYDVKKNSTRQITLEEAKKLALDPGPTSFDGFIVQYKYNNDGFFELFGDNGNDNGYFIVKGRGMKKLRGLDSGRYWDRSNFKFIGWIK